MTVPTTKPIAVSWSTEDLYNILMRGIEPDLCTDTMFVVDELYSGETAEERRVRLAWYEQAIDLFAERYHMFVDALKNEFQRAKKKYLRTAESTSDEGRMQSAEANIDSLLQP